MIFVLPIPKKVNDKKCHGNATPMMPPGSRILNYVYLSIGWSVWHVGYPLHRENRENVQNKIACQGKQGTWKCCHNIGKMQGIWFALDSKGNKHYNICHEYFPENLKTG